MIFIATHKDFKLKRNWKDTVVIDGGECKDIYNNVTVLHENEHPSRFFDLHSSYAEISRLMCVWKIYNKHLGEYVGFMQYKRQFNISDEEIIKILESHDAILTKKLTQHPNVIKAFGNYHRRKEIDWIYNRLPQIFPEYAESCEETLNGNILRPHNVFIMKRLDFLRYGYFLKRIYDAMDSELNYNTYEDIDVNYKLHGCLTERVSNIFYNKHFKNVYDMFL